MFDPQIKRRGCDLLPLKVTGLTYDAGGKRLIDGLDLELGAGLVTVILGPNGAGKSLLLRLLHGMLTPTGGDISWGGAALTQDVRQCQAMVFQRPVLLRRSVAANIDFVLKACRNVPRHDRGNIARRDELLSTVGLIEQRNQPARQLSGGEQQRLALARALALKPDVLFLDEATVNLDPHSVALIEEIIRDAHCKGTKIIAVTHDIGQAKRLADDVVFVYRGGVAEHRPAQEFFAGPISRPAQDHLAGRIVI